MREILFRGKSKDNGEWVEGYYSPCVIPTAGTIGHFINEGGYRAVEIAPETVGQYTGLTDKNGTKIFEGDIVIDRYKCEKFGFMGEVKYIPERTAYEIKSKEYPDYIANLGSRINSVKVLGNVFDNPELLKGGDEK